jgi:hypothetical protein
MNRSGNVVADLLRMLGEGGIHSVAELARRLGTGDEMIVAIAEDLQRRGFLTPLHDGCGAACGGCAMAEGCAAPGRASSGLGMLALTEKGRRWSQNPVFDTTGN